MPKMVDLASFGKTEACGQTVLPESRQVWLKTNYTYYHKKYSIIYKTRQRSSRLSCYRNKPSIIQQYKAKIASWQDRSNCLCYL